MKNKLFLMIWLISYFILLPVIAEQDPFSPDPKPSSNMTFCINEIDQLNQQPTINLLEYKLIGIINYYQKSFIFIKNKDQILTINLNEIIGKDHWQLTNIYKQQVELINWKETTNCSNPEKLIMNLR